MPPDGSTSIMGRSQTSPDERRVSHDSTVESESTMSTTPEPTVEKDTGDFHQEEVEQPIMTSSSTLDESRVQPKQSTDDKKDSVTKKMDTQKKDGEVDVMDIPNRIDLVWRNIYLFIYLHIAAAYGLYLFVTGNVMWQTVIWGEYNFTI